MNLSNNSAIGLLRSLPRDVLEKHLNRLSTEELEALFWSWKAAARPNQILPEGVWTIWLILAGRGWGKTRTGAEAVREWVEQCVRRIALLAATPADARDVMITGESGILNIYPESERPKYQPSLRRITWPNGAIATIYSAHKHEDKSGLRGPQHEKAWGDEPAQWQYPGNLEQLMFGLRLGENPQAVEKMANGKRSQLGSICAILVGISYEVVGLSYVLLPAEQQGGTLLHDPEKFLVSMSQSPVLITVHHVAFGLGAILGIALVLAVYDLARRFNETWVRWLSLLGLFGFAVTAIDNFKIVAAEPIRATRYAAGEALVKAIMLETDYLVSIDPHMWLGYGLVGLWVLGTSWILLKNGAVPRFFGLPPASRTAERPTPA